MIAGSAAGAGASEAGTKTFLPAIYQRGPSCPAGNDWTQFSLIRIQNPGTTTASDVDIYYFNPDGSLRDSELNYSIDGEKCDGCMACLAACPTEAISGKKQEVHTIDLQACDKCGICITSCKQDAIVVQ